MTKISKIDGSHTDPIITVLWEGTDEDAELMIPLMIPIDYKPGGMAGVPYYSVGRTWTTENGDEMITGYAYVKFKL